MQVAARTRSEYGTRMQELDLQVVYVSPDSSNAINPWKPRMLVPTSGHSCVIVCTCAQPSPTPPTASKPAYSPSSTIV